MTEIEIANELLKKVVRGTLIVFIGTFIYRFLEFISRVIIARGSMQAEYGLFSLGFVLLNIFVVISCLGLEGGVTRYIAYFRGVSEEGRIKGVIISSIQIVIIASVLCFFFAFFASDFISQTIFHSNELSTVLKIFSIAIPFLVIITILSSIFRGFDRVEEKVFFRDILMNVLKVSFILIAVFLGLSFLGMLYAYLASIVIAAMVFVVYTVKKAHGFTKKEAEGNPMRKELLYFSLPLFATGILGMIMGWCDTLMLGYFKTPDIVGLYNAAHPISQFVSLPLSSMLLIYLPIASQLYSKDLMDEMRRNYTILTKWVSSLALPLFLILLLFPVTVLNFLFGANYVPASFALQILVIGFFVNTLLGPNGATLIAIGETRFLMWASLIAVSMNVILNIVLIPPLGIVGASVASVVSIVSINMIRSIKLYSLSKVHPLSKNFLKSAATSILLIFFIYILAKKFLDIEFWILPILFIIFCGVYGLSLLFLRCFDKEDIMMLLTIEKRFGVNVTIIKKILKRFM